MKQFPTIKTERFVLCQFKASDLENVFNGLSHPEVIKYYGVSFKSLEETKGQMAWYKNLEETGSGIWWAIWSKDKKQFYRAGGLNDLKNKKAEIGFWLLPVFWGQGIMQEVMPLTCNYAFKKFRLERIEGFVETKNINCKRGLAKLDFNCESTALNCEIKEGEKISVAIYVMENPALKISTS